MINISCEYKIKEDLEFLMDTEQINASELSETAGISRTAINEIIQTGKAGSDVCEKIYSFIYKSGYRINSTKVELAKEKYNNILFHGSKNGLSSITISNSRENCDFGKALYLGETYNQALSFVCEKENSSVYSFRYSLDCLKIKKFDCNLEWMLAICFYRGGLREYKLNKIVSKIISDIENADVIVAPIADNKMFYIMNQFTDGDINADVALHSLSASGLGLQYVFRTDKALNNLKPVERYYISVPERDDCIKQLEARSYEVDTKLKLSKREFKNGLFIEEIFK